jgi:TonB-dependent starch-binding outer membrane protein SusC
MKNFLNLVCLLFKQHRKKLIVMRNTVLILLISALQVFATGSYAQTKTISLAMNDATIREVLYAIQNQSEFYFLYNSELIDVVKKVDITIEEEKVDAILTRLFNKSEVDFLIRDRYIVLTPVGGNAELFDQQHCFRNSNRRIRPAITWRNCSSKRYNPGNGYQCRRRLFTFKYS